MAFGGLREEDVLRTWPTHWDLPVLLRSCRDHLEAAKAPKTAGAEARPPPQQQQLGRFLHPALELREVEGRGRGLIALRPIAAGELALVDVPLITASCTRDLVEAVLLRANGGGLAAEDFRRVLLGLCGESDDAAAREVALSTAAVPAGLVEGIVLHNCHDLEEPGLGSAPESGGATPTAAVGSAAADLGCGLWPLASLVNHSLRPNVARCFLGKVALLRLARPLRAGEELLDNYVDPRLPREERAAFLARRHQIVDEGPDVCDAAGETFPELERGLSQLHRLLEAGRVEDAHRCLVGVAGQCRTAGKRDPGFTDILWAFADIAREVLGDPLLRLECLTAALWYLTAREPACTVSCRLAAELWRASHGIAGEAVAAVADRRALSFGREYGFVPPSPDEARKMAREHCERVYGPGAFEALFNLASRSAPDAAATSRSAKDATVEASRAPPPPGAGDLLNSLD
eukprot:TRINITY_DN30620_c0_g1_i2.p1 TRINITY_DN30620_c0_g1~~TRINITY_DN30620_c0_g1_i2.p1  ORF type:complete len:461 (-),score=112.60 TRINITY_DN30620_c0_g1_i2:132-1514(-)